MKDLQSSKRVFALCLEDLHPTLTCSVLCPVALAILLDAGTVSSALWGLFAYLFFFFFAYLY